MIHSTRLLLHPSQTDDTTRITKKISSQQDAQLLQQHLDRILKKGTTQQQQQYGSKGRQVGN